MPLDFPNSPTNGAVYGSYVYDSSLPGWRSKGGAVAATYVSDTAPSGAVKGDMWYRSSDGTTYVYVVDADTSQWVEIRSEISTARVGLVPIIPTSVTVGSGVATVSGSGLVTVTTNASTVSLNGVFTSAYSNYRIIIEVAGSNNDVYLHARMRANGTDDTVNNYHSGGYQGWSNGTAGTWAASPNTLFFWGLVAALSSGPVPVTVEISNPALTTYTKAVTLGVVSGSSAGVGGQMIGSALYTTTSYDGITFVMGSGNVAAGARFKIYGYN